MRAVVMRSVGTPSASGAAGRPQPAPRNAPNKIPAQILRGDEFDRMGFTRPSPGKRSPLRREPQALLPPRAASSAGTAASTGANSPASPICSTTGSDGLPSGPPRSIAGSIGASGCGFAAGATGATGATGISRVGLVHHGTAAALAPGEQDAQEDGRQHEHRRQRDGHARQHVAGPAAEQALAHAAAEGHAEALILGFLRQDHHDQQERGEDLDDQEYADENGHVVLLLRSKRPLF
jgi:hypothetical protein